jgi:hypothetical protein
MCRWKQLRHFYRPTPIHIRQDTGEIVLYYASERIPKSKNEKAKSEVPASGKLLKWLIMPILDGHSQYPDKPQTQDRVYASEFSAKCKHMTHKGRVLFGLETSCAADRKRLTPSCLQNLLTPNPWDRRGRLRG